MKNLITSTACILLLMAFVVQFAHNQVLYHQVVEVGYVVELFQETVKNDGCISRENQDWLQESVSEILGCEKGDILVEGASAVAAKGENIHYEVKLPIKRLLAAPEFWGIDTLENQTHYVISRDVVSTFGGNGK